MLGANDDAPAHGAERHLLVPHPRKYAFEVELVTTLFYLPATQQLLLANCALYTWLGCSLREKDVHPGEQVYELLVFYEALEHTAN